MKKSLIYLVVILGVFLSQSCSQNKTPIENQLARVWQVDIANTSSVKDSNSFLKLSIENDVQKFVSQFNGRKDLGTWRIEDSNVLILSSPLQNMESTVDSVTQVFDENGEITVQYFKDNDKIASFSDGKFQPKQFEQKFDIFSVKNDTMILVFETGFQQKPIEVLTYVYQSKIIPTSISVYSVSRGLFGVAVLIFITFLFSSNRKAINWSLVGKGLGIQLLLAF
ncbi:MAG: Na+ dependent nucleoside transporter N-terminal domain-containing protein, partial [Flavobacteriales bacterium]